MRISPRLSLFASLAAAALLAGCTGIATTSPKDYAQAIAASPAAFAAALAAKPDGTYRGSYTIALPPGSFAAFRHFEVDVRVADGAIAAVDLVQPEAMKTAEFFDALLGRVVAKQNLDVDAVSGVTYSSESFLKAVENAIEK